MASHHVPEFDSRNSTPDHEEPRVRFMCSFGGKILPRPHDDQLRYVGGDTRIVAVKRRTTFSSLLEKLAEFSGTTNISMKYQLPNEDLDALITITNDEDIENMMDEYDRLARNHSPHSKLARLRLFLFSTDPESRNSSISSLSSLLTGSAKREHWFFDALNGRMGSGLVRVGSEASSIVSEVPDYLFGLDGSDDPSRDSKSKTRRTLNDTASNSDPGSPAPVLSSPFCSTSSGLGPAYLPPIPDLRPVKTKPEIPVSEPTHSTVQEVAETGDPTYIQQPGYGVNPMWQYGQGGPYSSPAVQNMPVYYIPGSGPQPGTVGLQQVPVQAQFVQRFSAGHNQIPVGLHQQVPGMGQVYARERTVSGVNPYDIRRTPSGVSQQIYYDQMGNTNVVPMYSRMVGPGEGEIQGSGNEPNPGRVL